jgi:hypothetical protein
MKEDCQHKTFLDKLFGYEGLCGYCVSEKVNGLVEKEREKMAVLCKKHNRIYYKSDLLSVQCPKCWTEKVCKKFKLNKK